MINDKLKKIYDLFHSEQYEYFTNKGLVLGIASLYGGYVKVVTKNDPGFNKKYKVRLCNKEQFLRSSVDYEYIKGIDFDNFDKWVNYDFIIVNDYDKDIFNLNLDFLVTFCKKYPQYTNSILSNYRELIPDQTISNDNIKEQHEDRILTVASRFMDNLPHNQRLAFIPSFPVNTWEIKTIPLPKLLTFLNEKNFNDLEIDQTLFLFLKSRKKQLSDMVVSTEVKYFLLDYYKENLASIDKYLDFIPVLKSHFDTPAVSYVTNTEQLCTHIVVNIKDLKNSFLIDQYNEADYITHMDSIVNGIGQYYNIPKSLIVVVNDHIDTCKSLGIFLMHDNPQYTKEWIEQKITGFFSHLQTDPTFTINVDNVSKWCHNKDLEAKIDLMNLQPTTTNKKLKI